MKKIYHHTKTLFVKFSVLVTFILLIGLAVFIPSSEEHDEVMEKGLQDFTVDTEAGLVKNAESKVSFKFSHKPLKKIVLLFHSFVTSSEDYKDLLDFFDQNGIPYYAPTILGFGLSETNLLENIRAEDWIRDALGHYDLCSAIADEVHIVGDSFGSLLATMVAKNRKVSKLILLSPPFAFKGKALALQKRCTSFKIISLFLEHVKKYIKIPLKMRSIFRYESVPVRSLVALLKLQTIMFNDPDNQIKDSDLTIMYGKKDDLLDMNAVFSYFKKLHIPHKTYTYNAGHSLFIDGNHTRNHVVEDIGRFFTEE
jgi:esterase/lipase